MEGLGYVLNLDTPFIHTILSDFFYQADFIIFRLSKNEGQFILQNNVYWLYQLDNSSSCVRTMLGEIDQGVKFIKIEFKYSSYSLITQHKRFTTI